MPRFGHCKSAALSTVTFCRCEWCVNVMKLPSAPTSIRLLLSSNVCIKAKGVLERIDLILCECRSRLAWQKRTIRLLQTALQQIQLLKLKPGQNPGLTYWPVTRPDPDKIVDLVIRWPVMTGRPGSISNLLCKHVQCYLQPKTCI